MLKNTPTTLPGPAGIWLPATFSILFTICFLISTVVFSRFVYANTSPSVGGGAPIEVQLVVTDSLTGVQSFPLKINNGVTEKVILIEHSGSGLVVLRSGNNQVIEISESQVLSILHWIGFPFLSTAVPIIFKTWHVLWVGESIRDPLRIIPWVPLMAREDMSGLGE